METEFTRESTQLRFQRSRHRKANLPTHLLMPLGVSGWVSVRGPVHVWGSLFTGGQSLLSLSSPCRERNSTLPSGMGTGTRVRSPAGASSAGNRSHVISPCWLHLPGPQNISVTKTGAIQENSNKECIMNGMKRVESRLLQAWFSFLIRKFMAVTPRYRKPRLLQL